MRPTVAGILTIKDSGGNAVLTFDASAGAEITKKLTMPGASSAIAIGTTPPTAANAGTGVWIDRTGLYGLNGGVYQVKIDATNGALYAGEGNIRIDDEGIRITGGATGHNGIRWTDGSFSMVGAKISFAHIPMVSSYLFIQCLAPTGRTAYLEVTASDNAGSLVRTLTMTTSLITSQVGLSVTGNLSATGNLSVDGGVISDLGVSIGSVTSTAEVGVLLLGEKIATPTAPTNGTECKVYMKEDKLIIQYKDGATLRYKYPDLTGTGVTWVHTTSAP